MSFIFKKKNEIMLFILLFNYAFSKLIKMKESMEKPFRDYINLCKEGQILPERDMDLKAHPKISIIIPMHNNENNIETLIRSIQNQNLQEVEIICINDDSDDNTFSIVKKLQYVDSRIRIFNHKKKRGSLYNRISGALKSKGEYVTFLDADDSLNNIDILNKAYNIATKDPNEKIDIVHYQACGSAINKKGEMEPFLIFYTYNKNNFNQIIRQPEISDNYMQKKNNITSSIYVFDKIYRRELIKRVANYIGPHIWNQNLVNIDDFLLCLATMKMAKSIVNIGEVGYWHHLNKTMNITNVWKIEGNKLKYPDESNKMIGDYMTVLERILELTENEPQMEEVRESIIKELTAQPYIQAVIRSVHYDKFLSLLEKFYNWKFITNETKKRIKGYVKTLLNNRIDSEKKFSHIFK